MALARALVNRPRVLLLDEPLGALDLKLREEMQIELKTIQRDVGITFIFVTHDQDEALTMSDRIAVFNEGRVEQIGTPAEIYERPATAFVAGFVGHVEPASTGDVAQAIAGAAGRSRCGPEKIRMEEPGAVAGDGECAADGTVETLSTSASSPATSSALDAGAELVVVQQNLATSSMEALAAKGRQVTLVWLRQHNRPIEAPAASGTQPQEVTA